jgi:type 1 fimbriae regulatory protein FimB/type 1 fimbriae regulatory protein FimE
MPGVVSKQHHRDGDTTMQPNTIHPGKCPELSERDYLYPQEVGQLLDAVKLSGRHQHRDYTLVLLTYRHAMRISEAAALRWDYIDWTNHTILIPRSKGGRAGTHYLEADEIKALKKLQPSTGAQGFIFLTERGSVIDRKTCYDIVKRAGEKANLPIKVHPHTLRHSKGYQLANTGTDARLMQSYLGHVRIESTVRYTQVNPARHRGLGVNDLG